MADIPSRDEFLASRVDLSDVRTGKMSLHTLWINGAISHSPLFTLDYLHFVSAELPNEERTQYHQNPVDGGKINFFGRMPRIYSFSCFIIDSDLALNQGLTADDRRYSGNTLQEWMDIYESRLRLTKTLKNSEVVRIRWRTSEIYGHILGQARSHESNTPGIYTLGWTLIAMIEHEFAEITRYTGPEDVTSLPEGLYSDESYNKFRRSRG